MIRITHVFLHPQYKDVGFVNDVSLLRLEHEVNFTDFVRPVCLPSKDTSIRDGRMCTVVGWGQLYEVGRVFRKCRTTQIYICHLYSDLYILIDGHY